MPSDRFELEKTAPETIELAPRPAPEYPNAHPYGYGYGYGPEDHTVRLRQILRVVRKRKWLLAGIALVVTTIVAIDAYRTKSQYQASAVIEIGSGNTTMVRSNDVIIQYDDPLDIAMRTNTITLKSPTLLEEVVVDLRLDQNPKFLDVTSKRSTSEALGDILARVTMQKSSTNTDESRGAPIPTTAVAPDPNLARSEQETERLSPYLSVLEANLAVTPIRDTRTMMISFTHTDPEIAAAVANGVAHGFIEMSFQNKTEKFTKASDWLDTSTRELKARLEKAQMALADYTREHNIFTTEAKDTLTTDKLSRLHEQVFRAETDRILKESLYQEVLKGRVEQVPEAFADERTKDLSKRLGELATQAAEYKLKYGPENPRLREVNEQMTSLREQVVDSRQNLAKKLAADYDRAARDEQALKAALGRAKVEAVQQNQDNIQFSLLKQDVDTAQLLYKEFLQKTSQANLEVAQQSKNVHVVSPARAPRTPVAPARFRMIMIAFAMSLAGGLGLAFLIERFDNTLKTAEDVGRYVQLPALGVIPPINFTSRRALHGKRKEIAANGNGSAVEASQAMQEGQAFASFGLRSSAAEAYRVLRTSVLLSAAGGPPKIILVTSAQAGEGKTTTAINTGISLAQLGSSVLVIDADLRKPTTHKLFNVDHVHGLSSYLSRDIPIDELIHKLQIPNLSLLPCGPIPPNPAELISSERMKSLIKLLGERYDHVLIDSPPIMNVTDPIILSTLVDGVILVAYGGKSSRQTVQRARQELQNVGAKIFGVVLNNLDVRREGYDDYYYYRYYQNRYSDQPEETSVV